MHAPSRFNELQADLLPTAVYQQQQQQQQQQQKLPAF